MSDDPVTQQTQNPLHEEIARRARHLRRTGSQTEMVASPVRRSAVHSDLRGPVPARVAGSSAFSRALRSSDATIDSGPVFRLNEAESSIGPRA